MRSVRLVTTIAAIAAFTLIPKYAAAQYAPAAAAKGG